MKGQFLICSYSELKTLNLFSRQHTLTIFKIYQIFKIHLCTSHLMLEALDGFIIVLGTDGHILYTRYLSILFCWESLRMVAWPSSFMSINFGLWVYSHDTTLFSSLLQKIQKVKFLFEKRFFCPLNRIEHNLDECCSESMASLLGYMPTSLHNTTLYEIVADNDKVFLE